MKKRVEKTLSKAYKILFAILGVIAAILGMIGIIVPGIPKTPFFLLSAYLLSRSSKRIHNYLMSIKIVNKTVTKFADKGGVSLKLKWITVLIMWCSIAISIWIRSDSKPFIYTILALGVVGAISVLFFVPGQKKEGQSKNDLPSLD